MSNHHRRQFLLTSLRSASILGFGELGILADLAPANEKGTRLEPDDVQLSADIAPLVKLIEDAPQEKIVGLMVEQVRKGMTYRQFLAAVFLAASRMNRSPHQVYVIYAAHQLSQELPVQDRLLPLFWAVAALKPGRGEGPRFPAMDLSKLPTVADAASDFGQAMGYADLEKAELSLLALCRLEGPKTAWNRLWVYASRNSNNIGHPAIALVQAWRTLETIGWRHAESLVQFVIRELVTRNPPALYPVNRKERSTQVHTLPPDWAGRKTDEAATVELLTLLHAGDASGACSWAFESLQAGRVQAQAIWDAVFLGAGEIMLRFNTSSQLLARPLHTTTSMNALHYAYRSCGDPAIRLLTLLMALDWTAGFIATEIQRGKLRDMKITDIPEVDVADQPDDAIAEIFSKQPRREWSEERGYFFSRYEGPREVMDDVSRMAFAYGRKHATLVNHHLFIASARQQVARKSTFNAHDFKFPAALFENYEWISPIWRPHMLATTMQHIASSHMPENAAVAEARTALS